MAGSLDKHHRLDMLQKATHAHLFHDRRQSDRLRKQDGTGGQHSVYPTHEVVPLDPSPNHTEALRIPLATRWDR